MKIICLPCIPMWCHQQNEASLIVLDGIRGVVSAQTKKFMWPSSSVEKIYFEIAKKTLWKNIDLDSTVHVNKKIRLSQWNLFCY